MNIYEAITNIMQEGYAITKSKRNQKQGFMYRGIDDVMNTFQPLLSKNRVFVVPEVIEQSREQRITDNGNTLLYSILRTKYTFYSEDGSSVSAVVVGEGMDSGDKASNKALAVGMKYAMFQVFCIPTEEMPDPDAETPEPTKPKDKPLPKHVDTIPEDMYFRCADCGAVLSPYTDENGKTVSVRRWANATTEKYGRRLCRDCVAKLNESPVS